MTRRSDQQSTPPRRLTIDLADLVDMMDTRLDESQAFLDLTSGEIHLLSDELLSCVAEDDVEGVSDWERDQIPIAQRINDGDEHLAEIPPFDSADSFRIMQDFVGRVEDGQVQAQLAEGLSRPKPFRGFKDALREFPALPDRWFAFDHERKEQLAVEWLRELGIEAIPP
jgi:hypothetical protein